MCGCKNINTVPAKFLFHLWYDFTEILKKCLFSCMMPFTKSRVYENYFFFFFKPLLQIMYRGGIKDAVFLKYGVCSKISVSSKTNFGRNTHSARLMIFVGLYHFS